MIKDDVHYYILFNEEETSVKTGIKIPVKGNLYWLDEFTGKANAVKVNNAVDFEPHELKILMVEE